MVHTNTHCHHPPTHASTWTSLQKPLSFAVDVEGPALACDPIACCSVAAAESSCMATGLIFAGATSFPAFKHSNTGTRLAGKLARNSKGNNTRRSIVDDGWLATIPVYKLKQDLTQTQMTHLGRDMLQHWTLYSHSKNFTKVAESLPQLLLQMT